MLYQPTFGVRPRHLRHRTLNHCVEIKRRDVDLAVNKSGKQQVPDGPYGVGGIQQLVVRFDDPARSNDLLYVDCADKQPYDVWWPNAPL